MTRKTKKNPIFLQKIFEFFDVFGSENGAKNSKN